MEQSSANQRIASLHVLHAWATQPAAFVTFLCVCVCMYVCMCLYVCVCVCRACVCVAVRGTLSGGDYGVLLGHSHCLGDCDSCVRGRLVAVVLGVHQDLQREHTASE